MRRPCVTRILKRIENNPYYQCASGSVDQKDGSKQDPIWGSQARLGKQGWSSSMTFTSSNDSFLRQKGIDQTKLVAISKIGKS